MDQVCIIKRYIGVNAILVGYDILLYLWCTEQYGSKVRKDGNKVG